MVASVSWRIVVAGVSSGRPGSTVHNWVHKADLQPDSGKNPDHVAVDETVIRLNDEQYWLYAVVNPETNELLNTRLKPTTNTAIAQTILAEVDEKHDISNAIFLVDGSHSFKLCVTDRTTILDMKCMEIKVSLNVFL